MNILDQEKRSLAIFIILKSSQLIMIYIYIYIYIYILYIDGLWEEEGEQ